MANLAAGCFRKRSWLEQQDSVNLDTVNLGDGLANHGNEIGDRARALTVAQNGEELQWIRPGNIETPRV
jgi:hypothetical protein